MVKIICRRISCEAPYESYPCGGIHDLVSIPPSCEMRVLMIDAEGFSPPYDYALTAALRARGVDVRIVEPNGTGELWSDADALPSSRSSRFRGLARLRKGLGHLRSTQRLLARIQSERPDVLHFQWLPLPVVDELLLRRLKGKVPMVYTMHNTSVFHGAGVSAVQGWRIEKSFPFFDRIVVHSDYGRACALRAKRATDRQLVCIPHGAFVHYSILSPPDAADRTGPFTFLFIGSIKAYKGLDLLLQAFGSLVLRRPLLDVRLIVAGSPGFDLAQLRDDANRSTGGAKIEWRLRHQSEREMAHLLAQAHAVVLPYREIDQSGVLLAAVAMHRAVIASRVGGFPEVIRDGENGLLVPPDEVGALSGALERLAEDTDLRLQFESSMRSISRGALSWGSVAAQTEAMYRSLLSS
jgi:glycosyltransferase involved in cell wall biosynthesis